MAQNNLFNDNSVCNSINADTISQNDCSYTQITLVHERILHKTHGVSENSLNC